MINDAVIRKAHSDDAGAISRIHVESWRAVYRDILPASYLRQLDEGRVVRSVQRGLKSPAYIYLMAEAPGGAPMGYICGGPERTDDPIYRGEIYELYISPCYQRMGTGRKLLSALATELHDRGFYTLMVWVLASNPNHRFYEKTGGIYLGVKTISFAGRKLRAAAYGWVDITLADVDYMEG